MSDADIVREAREMSDLLRRGGAGWLMFAEKMPDIFDAALDRLEKAEAKRDEAIQSSLYCEGRWRRAEARVARLEDLLLRLRQWDHMAVAADGPFWMREIDVALASGSEGGET